jgi:hypothetical protein
LWDLGPGGAQAGGVVHEAEVAAATAGGYSVTLRAATVRGEAAAAVAAAVARALGQSVGGNVYVTPAGAQGLQVGSLRRQHPARIIVLVRVSYEGSLGPAASCSHHFGQGCWEAFCGTGLSSASTGRNHQHNCFPSALVCKGQRMPARCVQKQLCFATSTIMRLYAPVLRPSSHCEGRGRSQHP